ncbi:MAG: hypothetical protein ACJAWV_002993 [Flammeovirgaceae bacterium]|jgi:hypothetical protein
MVSRQALLQFLFLPEFVGKRKVGMQEINNRRFS